MTVHGAAADGFERGAAAYERGRPTYPKEAVEWMVASLGISDQSTVVDLGAGTGKFTRLLLHTGATIIAVEPVAGMRAQLQRLVEQVAVVDATAEAMPLADGSVDAVVAAQAFHWFATPRALDGIHRVLRRGGGLGLIWNRRDLRDPLQAALDQIVRPHRGDAPAHERDSWRAVLEADSRFRLRGERQFSLEQPAAQEAVVDRVVSTSFIAGLDDAARAEIERRVRALVPTGAAVVLRYLTDVFVFERD